ncbi:MAG: fosmidomycin resistance protein, partial [Lancefieldella rimae]
LLPCAKGTAFGIASFSLAVGSLPALLGFVLSSPLVLAVLAAVSLALLLGGLYCADQADACGV